MITFVIVDTRPESHFYLRMRLTDLQILRLEARAVIVVFNG
jgi:hypothetical protein